MATPVLMPRQGQSVESCILVDWQVAPGDAVEQGAILANIETDKASFEVEAPESGTVLALFFEPGDDVPVLTHIAAIGAPGEDVTALRPDGAGEAATQGATEEAMGTAPAATPDVVPPEAPSQAESLTTGVSPRARNLAARIEVSTQGLSGTGPGGRVIERDVQRAAEEGRPPPPVAAAVPPVPSAPSAPLLPGATEVPVDGIRKIIAERMHASLATTAQLTLNRSFDATSLLEYRAQVKARGEKFGMPNITINDIIAFVTIRLLTQHPELNAHWLGDRIVRYDQVHLGIAMDTARGLMVPVISEADRLSLREVSLAIKPIVEAARTGSINPDLLQGGTFTLTNLGTLGIESFTPILNAPEVAILGVGGLFLKPVQTEAGVEHVQAINLSLTINHQAVDGAPGARFLAELAASLEDVDLVLAG